MTKQWAGMTLIETLLVLGLVSLLLLFPSLEMKNWRMRQEAQYFFTNLERELFLAQQAAVVNGKKTAVRGSSADGMMTFTYDHSGLGYQQVTLPLPVFIRLKRDVALSFRPKSGTINRITSLKFESDIKPHRIDYQYFIGSGRFEKRG